MTSEACRRLSHTLRLIVLLLVPFVQLSTAANASTHGIEKQLDNIEGNNFIPFFFFYITLDGNISKQAFSRTDRRGLKKKVMTDNCETDVGWTQIKVFQERK